eukprot:255757-Pyramimonas_sp.AAC.1
MGVSNVPNVGVSSPRSGRCGGCRRGGWGSSGCARTCPARRGRRSVSKPKEQLSPQFNESEGATIVDGVITLKPSRPCCSHHHAGIGYVVAG